MASALFDVNLDGADQGYEAGVGEALSFTLRESPPVGVQSWLLQVFDSAAFVPTASIASNPPRQSPGAPELVLDNGGGSTGQAVTATAPTAEITTTLPGGTHSWIVRSVVNGGMSAGPDGKLRPDPTLVHERLIFVPTSSGARKVVATETRQQSDDGLAEAIARLVDAMGGGGAYNPPVRAATTAALPANTRTGDVLTANANGALPAIDGVTLIVGDRLLVKNEATGANNGVFDILSVGSGGSTWSMRRAADLDETAEAQGGDQWAISEGTTNGDKLATLSTNDPITINTTALVFTIQGGGLSAPANPGDDGKLPVASGGNLIYVDDADVPGTVHFGPNPRNFNYQAVDTSIADAAAEMPITVDLSAIAGSASQFTIAAAFHLFSESLGEDAYAERKLRVMRVGGTFFPQTYKFVDDDEFASANNESAPGAADGDYRCYLDMSGSTLRAVIRNDTGDVVKAGVIMTIMRSNW